MNNPDLFVVIWNGVMLEGEWPDAITFSQDDAEAFIALSPGRKESYEILVSPMRVLLDAAPYCLHTDQVHRQLAEGNRAPIMLRDETQRAHRAR